MVESRATSARRESSRVCWTTIGTSEFEYRCIVGVARDFLRLVEVIEAQMQGSPRLDGDAEGTDRLAVGKEDRDGHMGVARAGIEDAGRLVGDQRAIGKRAFRGDIAFGNGP